MAKKATNASEPLRLFSQQEQAHERRMRRQRALFIPKIVREVASHTALAGKPRDRAYEIILQWAELETAGHLPKYNETTIDTQFLDQIFGEGLGYQVKTKSPTDYQLDHKHAVKGAGIADAALGEFPRASSPKVIIELKGSMVDLDRTRSNGRTAVDQCWDYLSCLPDAEWGIVSNFSSIRLYHKSKGKLNYEDFSLQELRDQGRFNDFYAIFERGGLLTSSLKQPPRALALLQRTEKRQKEVGDDLYESYRMQRLRLIDHLMRDEGKGLDQAIAIAQKLLDRIIFIAFCEDRGLLPERCLERAHTAVPAFSRVKNPRWHNFLGLFGAVDKGSDGLPPIAKFNGGLFADDKEIDDLELDDEPWTSGFKGFGSYDFSEEVNVEVLGHLFERSITELEKLRVGGLFALKANIEGTPSNGNSKGTAPKGKAKPTPATKEGDDSPLDKMPKSAQRKRFGIYYTPPPFTGLIVERTVDALIADRFAALAKQHKVDPDARKDQNPAKMLGYWKACYEALKTITVCDPACGSGAFLIRAYDALDAHYKAVIHGLAGSGEDADRVRALEDAIPDDILNCNLFGVDLSREGVEITQLALWIRSARKGKTLADLSKHIIHGNSLVSDTSVDPKALDWHKAFPHIFAAGGFDCLIGNPPWEQMMLHDREFFGLADPEIATEANAARREKMIDALVSANPELHAAYTKADESARRMLAYARESGQFPLTGKGRTNLYMAFAERAQSLVSPTGRVGLLLPSGIATDHTTKDFFGHLVTTRTLNAVYDFVNRLGIFPDVESRLKFCVLLFNGAEAPADAMDFVFWAERIEDLADSARHITLTARDIKLLNPNTQTCPIFRSQRDAELAKAIYRRVPVLMDHGRKQGGNPWGVRFKQGLFNATADSALFHEAKEWEKKGYTLVGNTYVKNKKRALPLLEAKMTREYDHRASWIEMNPNNAYMNYSAESVSLVDHQNPEFLPKPRYWVAEEHVVKEAPATLQTAVLAFHDIARSNDTRTMVACLSPYAAYSNTLPFVVNEGAVSWRRFCCLAGCLNSFAYDFLIRQKANNAHLNFFIVEQIPTLPPDAYDGKCAWKSPGGTRETLEHWISERVLKLSCTAEDMIPLAKACDFKGSRGDGVHIWKEKERAELRAELDAAYFILYGIERADVEYMLSTFTGTGFIDEDQRGDDGNAWERGGEGDMILEAYDHLSGLVSAR